MDDCDVLTTLTAEIVTSYVARNRLTAGEIGSVISAIHTALAALQHPPTAPAAVPVHVRAVSIRKSLADPTRIISMIDGRSYKVLKQHLGRHGLTPAAYRTRYGLPADYPVVAPAYSSFRSAKAKEVGLGRRPSAPALATSDVAAPRARLHLAASSERLVDRKPPRRGRPKLHVSNPA